MWKKEHHLSDRAAGFNAKLAARYSGLYEIKRVISPVIYDLKSRAGKWIRHVHVQELKPAPAKNAPDDIDDAAEE